ncbi:flagellar assembly factor FliW [Clostridium tetanomorphum]|uniref:Flagellar assembly factor FliW n=1 Tax=Clostridium tetanomorphum TaxID=1553 RepID=A0A923J274_CLOTT|nr:flagellar assembly protein FliW [Clostridium tetanomorphum]KAJ53500.1 flagellar assembly protein FliW [Clostridium tetanomorphum DSM 665]MBC2398425.1 flagellar assembly protein FliW [Clostridium tetanomorphum]MBP1865267.1 flagellar assembly factor FliW [Clostridium tetanomorphum]NRS85190.1 flagellar assembly factor FliW [Clostridium tetanomorphum]NRZ98369.1 flagellar assembly factor FliW [Clostridium tetanomorphum]
MKLNTKYHGEIEYKEEDVIVFKKGLPGFETLKKFIVFPLEENDIFKIVHSIEDNSMGLPVVSPFIVYKDYKFSLSDEQINNLNIKDKEDVLVLNTVTISCNYKDITTNLKAPIIINIKDKVGEQIILDNDKYEIKYPIFREEV